MAAEPHGDMPPKQSDLGEFVDGKTVNVKGFFATEKDRELSIINDLRRDIPLPDEKPSEDTRVWEKYHRQLMADAFNSTAIRPLPPEAREDAVEPGKALWAQTRQILGKFPHCSVILGNG